MSHDATASGRVQSIKSKFESLHSIESLDIGGSTVKKQPRSIFVLKRSATSLDLPAKASPPVISRPLTGNVRRLAADSTVGRNMEVQRQASDSFLFKNRNIVVRDQLKPLKEIKENVEVRLSRHTSDPVKRSSIKRSPAFRVGNGGAGGDKTTGKIPLIKTMSIPKELTDKFDELLKRCAPEVNEAFTEVGMTDTLKAALKQPLPTGPPPKKPPRAFETPSPKDDVNPITLFMKKSNVDGDTAKDVNAPAELKTKLRYLEQNLVLNATGKAGQNGAVAAGAKEKNHLLANSFLSCIPCSSPIYDSGLKSPPKLTNGHRKLLNGTARNGPEPIYMEPFSHLKKLHACDNINGACANDINGKVRNGEATATFAPNSINYLNVSCSSCGVHQVNGSDDIHYLVSQSG